MTPIRLYAVFVVAARVLAGIIVQGHADGGADADDVASPHHHRQKSQSRRSIYVSTELVIFKLCIAGDLALYCRRWTHSRV